MAERGDRVEVRTRFSGAWARGFEVVETIGDPNDPRYRVRRSTDGEVLPVDFSSHDVRVEDP